MYRKGLLYSILALSLFKTLLTNNQMFDFSNYFNKNVKYADIFTSDRKKSTSKDNSEKISEKSIRIKNSFFGASFGDAFGNEVEFIKNIEDIMPNLVMTKILC